MTKKIFVILLVALLVRLISIDQSLWLDEATTANIVKNYSYSQILTIFSPNDFHPPLYYWFMKFWTDIFNSSETSLRFPSVILSLFTGWTLYLIGKKIKSEKVGLWLAALFLFNPLIIYYSQEARMYSLITLLITVITYYLLRINPTSPFGLRGTSVLTNYKNKRHSGATEKSDRILNKFQRFYQSQIPIGIWSFQNDNVNIAFCNLFIFFSFLTFYGSVFFIVSIYLYLLIKKEFKLLLYLLPGFLLSFILVSPLLYQQFLNSKIVIKNVLNWSLVLGQANIKNMLLIPIKLSIGKISFEPKIFYYLVSGLWSIFVFYPVIHSLLSSSTRLRIWSKVDSRSGSGMTKEIFLWLFLGPVILGFLASFYTPLLQYFRFIYLIPIMIILITVSSNKNWQKIAILLGFTLFSLNYLLNPNYHREDWKNLALSLDNKRPVYMIYSSSDPIKYYDNKIEIRDIKNLTNYKLENNIQIIPYSTEIHGISYQQKLKDLGYKLSSEKSFREVKIEEWGKK